MKPDMPFESKKPPSRALSSREHLIPLGAESFQEVSAIPAPYQVRVDVPERIAKLSGGKIGLQMIRRAPGSESTGTPWHYHSHEYIVSICIKGWARFEFDGIGEVLIEAGTVMYQVKDSLHREIESSEDFAALEFTCPAHAPTTLYFPDENGEPVPHSVEG